MIGSFLLAGLATSLPASAEGFIKHRLNVTTYKSAVADLNGDGSSEVFVYSTERDECGSGGCNLYVLSPHSGTFRVMMESSVTQLPVRLLATKTHGWRDIGVMVVGGGILTPYMARMRFNGRRYPSNPTVPPAIPMRRPYGRVLIRR